MRRVENTVGGPNIFADLGLPDADEMLLKADLVACLRQVIAGHTLSLATAAEVVGMAQGDLSRLLRGSIRGCSAGRLMTMLTSFGLDIVVTVRAHDGPGSAGRIIVDPSPGH